MKSLTLVFDEYKTLIRFLVVGVLNTFVGLGTIWALKYFLNFNDILANNCGYAVGLTVSYTLNSRWTFNHKRSVTVLFKFLCTFAVAYMANLATVLFLIETAGINSYIAQALGVPVYTATFYLGSKYFTFRSP